MLRCENIKKSFEISKHPFKPKFKIDALKGINLNISENEIIGIVGESGSGKSTLAKILLLLTKPDEGKIFYKETEITNKKHSELIFFRKEVQAVFQDPYSSLNPRLPIIETLSEPLTLYSKLSKKDILYKVGGMLEKVGLSPEDMYKYPHEFSGGQRQRINIARAIILNPTVLIADEPVSSLDVSIQAQVINLFLELQKLYKFSMIFISHDLRIVRHISDKIAVMYQGEIVEFGERDKIFMHTSHTYTKSLINALPENQSNV